MLKLPITYKTFDDEEITEDFYFNLKEDEILEMELSTVGGLENMLNRLMRESDNATIVAMFKRLILQSYGEKSPDGKRFVKTDELSTGFSQTNAYAKLYVRLSTDAEFAAQFVNGIMPANMRQDSDKPTGVIGALS